jgi:hypothetical protein
MPSVEGVNNDSPRKGYGVHGESDIYSTGDGVRGCSFWGTSVSGLTSANYGVYGFSSGGNWAGVRGDNSLGTGVVGSSERGTGVYGFSINGLGVDGYSTNRSGVVGRSDKWSGVFGESKGGYGVHGSSTKWQVCLARASTG